MRIAIAQIECAVGDVHANLKKMVEWVELAKSRQADVVVFPEMSDTGYSMGPIVEKASNWTAGPVVALQKAAQIWNINIVAGLSEREGDSVYNSIAVINREGKLTAKYRKTHLITAEPVCEHKHLAAGNELVLASIDNVPVGLMTCYDIRFPEVSRALTDAGAKIIVIPAAFPLVRITHWRTLAQARAIENQVFVVAVNRVGTDDPGLPLGGSSLIVDPNGEILLEAPENEPHLREAELNLDLIQETRSRVHIQDDRRPDLYSRPVKVLQQ